ncbi:MAG: hypothetical protein WC052_00960 [Patescibacteria group bacterium]|jgi:hypothetical protein
MPNGKEENFSEGHEPSVADGDMNTERERTEASSSGEFSFRDEGNVAEIRIDDPDRLWRVCRSICAVLGNEIADNRRDYFFNKEMGGELRPGGVFCVTLTSPGVIWASVRNNKGNPEYVALLRRAVEEACAS